MNRARALTAWLVPVLIAVRAAGAEPMPVLFQSAPGRFEVAAVDATAAQAVVARAEEAWQLLAAPLALPDAFSSPMFVRLVPAAEWRDAAPFRVIVEAGGVVSVRVGWSEATPETVVRHSLVQVLLMRLAVAQHGVNEKIVAPRWLEQAGVGWWQTRADAAQLDALKQETERFGPPALTSLLNWRRSDPESRELAAGAVWLLAFLQAESGRAGEWPALLQRLLGGETPLVAFAEKFPGRFSNDAERELWWQTGWHHLRRGRTLPTLEAVESRGEIAGLARFVFARGGSEAVLSLRAVLDHAREPVVAAELKRRGAALNRLLPSLHPFYRNAGLSLAAALAAPTAAEERRDTLSSAFEQDWRDATELEAATTAALEALERERHSSSMIDARPSG